MPSQQSSFSGRRTAVISQDAIVAIARLPVGPAKMPRPSMQAYSVPERSTPSSRIGWPFASTSRLATTLTVRPGLDPQLAQAAAMPSISAANQLTAVRPRHRSRLMERLRAKSQRPFAMISRTWTV